MKNWSGRGWGLLIALMVLALGVGVMHAFGQGFTALGNDLWFLGNQGDTSLFRASADKIEVTKGDRVTPGDLQVGNLSSSAVGNHENFAQNGDAAGRVTLSGGTATVTFSTAYASTPVCVATDQTAANAVKSAPTTSNVVFTGTTTDLIAYQCVGNPN